MLFSKFKVINQISFMHFTIQDHCGNVKHQSMFVIFVNRILVIKNILKFHKIGSLRVHRTLLRLLAPLGRIIIIRCSAQLRFNFPENDRSSKLSTVDNNFTIFNISFFKFNLCKVFYHLLF